MGRKDYDLFVSARGDARGHWCFEMRWHTNPSAYFALAAPGRPFQGLEKSSDTFSKRWQPRASRLAKLGWEKAVRWFPMLGTFEI
jgi:hypothetical protein